MTVLMKQYNGGFFVTSQEDLLFDIKIVNPIFWGLEVSRNNLVIFTVKRVLLSFGYKYRVYKGEEYFGFFQYRVRHGDVSFENECQLVFDLPKHYFKSEAKMENSFYKGDSDSNTLEIQLAETDMDSVYLSMLAIKILHSKSLYG
ncbi:MAG: hypothetical protein ACI9CO_000003 [Candidatus Azotimanducaceae bacterium]